MMMTTTMTMKSRTMIWNNLERCQRRLVRRAGADCVGLDDYRKGYVAGAR
jgi:hypothetical protein